MGIPTLNIFRLSVFNSVSKVSEAQGWFYVTLGKKAEEELAESRD